MLPQVFINCYINCSLLYVQLQTVPPPQSKSLSCTYAPFIYRRIITLSCALKALFLTGSSIQLLSNITDGSSLFSGNQINPMQLTAKFVPFSSYHSQWHSEGRAWQDTCEANGLAYSRCPANTNDLAMPLIIASYVAVSCR